MENNILSATSIFPQSMTFDISGNMFIADMSNNIIEKIDTNGNITIFAGIISSTYEQLTPGPATNTYLSYPVALATDSSGNLYIADQGNFVIEKVTPDGTLSIVAGIIRENGNLVEGVATNTPIGMITAIAVDYLGNIYIADNDNSVIIKITPSGDLSIFAGNKNSSKPLPGKATNQSFGMISCIAVDNEGNVYGGDKISSVIFKITPRGTIYIIAGYYELTEIGYAAVYNIPTPGLATSSSFNNISGIAVDSYKNVYVLDSGLIVKIDTNGNLTIIAGTNSIENPTFSIAVGTGYDINSTTVSTLYNPIGIAIDISGYIYVCDQDYATQYAVISKVNIASTIIPPNNTITYNYTTVPTTVSYTNLSYNTPYTLSIQTVYDNNTYTYTIPITTLNESAVTTIDYDDLTNNSVNIFFNTSPGNSPSYIVIYQGSHNDTTINMPLQICLPQTLYF